MAAGLVCVALSDRILAAMPSHSMTAKRLMIVTINAVLVYFVIDRYSKIVQISNGNLRDLFLQARGFFQASGEAIIIAGRDGTIKQLNPRAETLFGYLQNDLAGLPFENLLSASTRKAEEVAGRKMFPSTGAHWSSHGTELSFRRKDGTEFPAEVTLTAFKYSGGHAIIALISDLTERLAIEREARRVETLNALGSVAAGLAHELNNPLAVIASRIELMLTSEHLHQETRHDLMVLQSNVERASRISRNMLSLARQRPGTRHSMDMNAVVEEAILIAGADRRGEALSIGTCLDRTLPPVFGDPTALQQVLINLVMNAREAGATAVQIETNGDLSNPDHLQITISDDGPGIDRERVKKVFEPFFTTKPGGTGLGLWLSQRIIQDHGGTIAVASEQSKGTKFAIVLPTLELEATDVPTPSAVIEPERQRLTLARGRVL
jgi:two-component system NtrC family sensor kinase